MNEDIGPIESQLPAPEYEVGYKRPPKTTRFRPGQSGNSRGRPKGSRNIRTELREVAHEMVTYREGDQIKRASKVRVVLMGLTNRALQGDSRAVSEFVGLALKFLDDDPEAPTENPLTEDEKEVLRDLGDRFVREANDQRRSGQSKA